MNKPSSFHSTKRMVVLKILHFKFSRESLSFTCHIVIIIDASTGLGRRGGLMVSALNSGSSGPGSRPSQGHCVLFIGKTLHSHSASLHPGV